MSRLASPSTEQQGSAAWLAAARRAAGEGRVGDALDSLALAVEQASDPALLEACYDLATALEAQAVTSADLSRAVRLANTVHPADPIPEEISEVSGCAPRWALRLTGAAIAILIATSIVFEAVSDWHSLFLGLVAGTFVAFPVTAIAVVTGLVGLGRSIRSGCRPGILMSLAPLVLLLGMLVFWLSLHISAG